MFSFFLILLFNKNVCCFARFLSVNKYISKILYFSVSKPCKAGGERKLENKFGDYIGKDPLPLPDISKLNINVEQKDLIQVGCISAMVDEFGKNKKL